ncbi:MAG TPA: BBP7 family outer membrane beta-barrel protein [Pirellulales bacterium]|nr:BBP7 family outer membrane beta-barrel protein [Pirellulales bacterium]
MIRVAVLIAAIAQFAVVAWGQSPRAPTPTKGVVDSYYLKRQQAKAAAVENTPAAAISQVSAPSLGPSFGFGADESAASELIDPQVAVLPQSANNRINALMASTQGNVPAPQMMHYASTNNDYSAGEEVPSAPQAGGDEEYVDGDCDGYGSPQQMSSFMAAVRSVPTTNVLWNEIYSCRSMWADFDYLGFWVKGNHVPPLVTTSPLGTPQNQAGVLGQPGTSILFGDQRLNTDMRSGGRVTLGAWLVGDVLAVEGNYYALGTETTNYNATSIFSNGSTSDPILARPYFNPAPPTLTPPPPHLPAQPPAQSALLVAYPNFVGPGGGTLNLDGSIHITSSSSIQSANVLLKRLIGVNLLHDHRMFLVGGYRWFRTEEGIQIQDNINTVGGGLPAGAGFQNLDSFGVKNNFNGGDIGLFSDIRKGRWVLETTGKIALGNMNEIVNIDGFTRVRTGTTSTDYAGGLLTQPSNMGVYRRNQFSMIPELNLKLGYQITPGWRATVGYNFTYITRLVRPGNEIDFVVNPPYTPGAPQVVARPMFLNNPTDMWLQGFTTGFEYRW